MSKRLAANIKMHEDERRVLYEFSYPVSKVIIASKDTTIGGEYHLKKNELAMLVWGSGKKILSNREDRLATTDLIINEIVKIEAGTYHKFELTEGSIILEWADSFYDPKDVYK